MRQAQIRDLAAQNKARRDMLKEAADERRSASAAAAAAAAPAGGELNAYELQRLANISRNENMLDQLGLGSGRGAGASSSAMAVEVADVAVVPADTAADAAAQLEPPPPSDRDSWGSIVSAAPSVPDVQPALSAARWRSVQRQHAVADAARREKRPRSERYSDAEAAHRAARIHRHYDELDRLNRERAAQGKPPTDKPYRGG